MNKDVLKGDWNLIKGKIKEKWGKLTEDDLTFINGQRDQLLGTIQKKYGIAKEKAAQQLAEWERQCTRECQTAGASASHSSSQRGHEKGSERGHERGSERGFERGHERGNDRKH